jgi:hypothetical protein
MATTTTATRAHARTHARSLLFGGDAAIARVAIGRGVAALTCSRRAGWIAGGATLALAAALRSQMARWFTDKPAYELERRIGDLEIRRHAPRIAARAHRGAHLRGRHRRAGSSGALATSSATTTRTRSS